MTDNERIDWLENNHTLHHTVEVLYIVDGYEARLCYDGDPVYTAVGDTYRKAIDTLIWLTKDI